MVRISRPRLTPLATPSMVGAAMGLRKTPWYTAPDRARMAPERKVIRVFLLRAMVSR